MSLRKSAVPAGRSILARHATAISWNVEFAPKMGRLRREGKKC